MIASLLVNDAPSSTSASPLAVVDGRDIAGTTQSAHSYPAFDIGLGRTLQLLLACRKPFIFIRERGFSLHDADDTTGASIAAWAPAREVVPQQEENEVVANQNQREEGNRQEGQRNREEGGQNRQENQQNREGGQQRREGGQNRQEGGQNREEGQRRR